MSVDAPPKEIAGRYVIERELGRGGAAIVYLAQDRQHERAVAVKVLRAELTRSLEAKRFVREARLTARLQHPHVVPILDSGDVDGLLYFVTPYLEGESLRARLDRERQLPLDDALQIARELADALQCAHEQGIIHRDLKPENVLFGGRHAYLADFGIAYALRRAGDDRLTSTGISVGTPAYMSPEQASGDRVLDGRSDVYSLGCVVYEMLAGMQPFVGPTPESVIAQRFAHPPRALGAYRTGVPSHVEAAVMRAMAIAPADRFASAAEFAAALGVPLRTSGPVAAVPAVSAPRGRRRTIAVAVAALAGVALLLAASRFGEPLRAALGGVFAGATPAGDSARLVILPAAGADGQAMRREAVRGRLYDAFRRWRDLPLVAFATTDEQTPPPSVRAARVDARRLGAGRFVYVHMSRERDSVLLRSTLYDLAGTALREDVRRVPDAADVPESTFRAIAAALLAVDDPPVDTDAGDAGTDRLEAWRAYRRGHAARARWDLEAAMREFRSAVDIDPRYAPALLWLTQVSAWLQPAEPAAWRDVALRATSLSGRLQRRDSVHASALEMLATERFPEACAAFAALRDADPAIDVPWYGLGQCRIMDPVVLRDPRSPTGWRFRASYHSAAAAYDSALDRAQGAPSFAFVQLQRALFVETYRFRGGIAMPPDTGTFAAQPSLQDDTLALIPYPYHLFERGYPAPGAHTAPEALRRNATRLGIVMTEWVRRDGRNPDAYTYLAQVQEMRGERGRSEADSGLAALRTTLQARALSTDPLKRIGLTVRLVRLHAKSAQFAEASRLADSLLAAVPRADAEQAFMLAGVAVLTGRAQRAAELLAVAADADPEASSDPTPAVVRRESARFLTHAALGACSDALRAFPAQIESLLERHVDSGLRNRVRQESITRPLSLAYPCLGAAGIMQVSDSDRLVRMQRAHATGQVRTVRAHFDTLRATRPVDRPGDVALHYTLHEAWLLAAMGDTAAAVRSLDQQLAALETLSTLFLRDVAQAASVGRMMLYRATLAPAGSPTRAQWLAAASALWKHADPEVRRTLDAVGR